MIFSKVLVAYDGSNLSKKALDKAIAIVKEKYDYLVAPQLIVMHVIQAPSYSYAASAAPYYFSNVSHMETDTKVLDEVKFKIPSTLNVIYVTSRGQPAHSILEYAHENNCDLIVMGSRGLGAIREFFLGSVSHNVVQNSKVPVLVVK
ncbi:Nucleotide-binding universal stress protein, UspA family [Paenibacillus sp. GP183]|nr:Nucleotide-binding universal stress protein, UspA family [Paenibacillus sp. GP183]